MKRVAAFRLQFGLASLIAMVAWSASLLWLQFVGRTVTEEPFLGFTLHEWRQHGWPFAAHRQLTPHALDENVAWFKAKGAEFVEREAQIRANLSDRRWHGDGIVLNAIVWLLSTTVVGALTEALCRRLARKAP